MNKCYIIVTNQDGGTTACGPYASADTCLYEFENNGYFGFDVCNNSFYIVERVKEISFKASLTDNYRPEPDQEIHHYKSLMEALEGK